MRAFTPMPQEIMQFVSQHPILSSAWIVLLVVVIAMTFRNSLSKVKEITRGEAIRLINKESAVVVDVRNREDYRKGHIASSVNVSAIDIKNTNIGSLEKHKKQPVIIVCASSMASRTPAENLVKAGFERVFILKDGITGWSGENLPLSRGK